MLVFFSNKLLCVLALLGLISSCAIFLWPHDKAETQRITAKIRRKRAAYRYVQEALSPPQSSLLEFDDMDVLQQRVEYVGRLFGTAGLSVLSGEVVMFFIRRIPWVKNIFDLLERRIQLCHDTIAIAQKVSAQRTQLREYFLGKQEMRYVKEIDATVVPNFHDHLLNYLEKKTSLENISAWVKKGVTSSFFFGYSYYFSKKGGAAWTYKSILEKVLSQWHEHQYFFPKELRPRFQLLYDAYIARRKTIEMDEVDAQRFIEWTCLDVIDALQGL